MHIRTLEVADVSTVAEIARHIMPHAWSELTFLNSRGRGYHAWVLEDQQHILGFIVIHVLLSECQIMNLGVDKHYQRKGGASYLLQHALNDAKNLGAKEIWLEVRASNIEAITLYKKFQFAEKYRRKNYYPGKSPSEREDALILAKSVT